MSCRGMLYAITCEEAENLRSIQDPSQRIQYLREELDVKYWSEDTSDLMVATDKSWDAIHRILSDGTLSFHGGKYPLNHVVFGGEDLSFYDTDFPVLLSLKNPEQVQDVELALRTVTKEWFSRCFGNLPDDYLQFVDPAIDLEYSWEYFEAIREMWIRVAPTGRFILFSVDQ